MTNLPQSRQSNIVVQDFEKEVLIYDLKINKAFCLNETSAMIWQLCNGKRTVEEISQSLTKKLKQPITEDVIWLALDGFKKDNLLENNEQFEIDFNSLSRRQVIKKVGFASMIILPIVLSIVAPSAAMAQSSGVLRGGSCPPTCAPGLQCRFNNLGGGSICCGPAPGGTVTAPPGPFLCLNNCATDTALVCCSGSGTTAPTQSFCTMNSLQTCTCNPYS